MRSTLTTRSIACNQVRWANRGSWAALTALTAALSLAGPAFSQEAISARPTAPPPLPTPVAPAVAPAKASGPLTISDIMAMHQAGLGDQVIIGSIHQHSIAATLGVEEMISMRRHGISNEVIQAMQQQAPLPAPKSAPAPPVRQVQTVVQPTVVEPVIVSPIYRPVYHPPVIYSHRYHYHHRHHPPVYRARSSFGIHVRF